MGQTPLYPCNGHDCSKVLRAGSYCCRPCRKTDGVLHGMMCTGVDNKTGGPRGAKPKR